MFRTLGPTDLNIWSITKHVCDLQCLGHCALECYILKKFLKTMVTIENSNLYGITNGNDFKVILKTKITNLRV